KNLNSVYMLSSTESWAVGSNGTILRYGPAESAQGGTGAQNRLLLWLIPILLAGIALGMFLLRRKKYKTESEVF
ncbi:MAG: hypothetical protein QMD00_04990, partial [Hadesarchaea archaeon]|nr:hypothetical protein [Hadesarchaea archaeon]